MRTSVERIMGTVISLAVPDTVDPELFDTAGQAAFASLREADEVFSPFLPDSPVSRIRDGRLRPADLDRHPHGEQITEVLELCATLKAASRGAFDAWAVGDPPGFDPCGAVKGWAAERAGALLTGLGVTRHILNAGGDVRLRAGGDPYSRAGGATHPFASGETYPCAGGDPYPRAGGTRSEAGAQPQPVPWRVGLTDSHRPGCLLAVLTVADGAVATSGTSERGSHIWNPATGRPATALAQVTVVGPELTLADGYATAAMAMADGSPARAHDWLDELAERTGYHALTVDPSGRVRPTAGLSGLSLVLSQPAAGIPGRR